MDNLKLFSKTEEEFQKQMQITFSDHICVEFRLDKCAKILLKKGRLVHLQTLIFDMNRENLQVHRD
jgi:hypothetical protein